MDSTHTLALIVFILMLIALVSLTVFNSDLNDRVIKAERELEVFRTIELCKMYDLAYQADNTVSVSYLQELCTE